MDAVNFTIGEGRVLSLILCAAVTDAEKEVTVLKNEACAEVESGGTVLGKGGFEKGFVIGPAVVVNAPTNDFGHALGFTVSFLPAGGVAKVDPSVAVVVRVQSNFK